MQAPPKEYRKPRKRPGKTNCFYNHADPQPGRQYTQYNGKVPHLAESGVEPLPN